ncbi:DUF6262 family protein [Streptomyces zagrosensis]|uniref:Regulator of replication initiation timing n=1 Tax=Streptomyces zagrosensis TaxID=1042984 RepID=A0A7W9V216_9ACTN|nr:DUF6262 family protein [Streptomyces zagrosensis]MBB5939512.1 regulator of replication initiation timing [Streptomyces zagrosensis]
MTGARRTPGDTLREARRRDSQTKRGKVLAALDAMKDSGTAITFVGVARAAEVSNWLVYRDGVREHIEAAMKGQDKAARRRREGGAGASVASLATDLELLREENKALRQERDGLKRAVQRSLGAALDQEGARSATQRIGDLQAEIHKVKDELAAARAQNTALKRQLADAQEEVIAVREAGRQMFKSINRPT